MDGGWICLKRSVFEHPMFDHEPYNRRDAWIWLIAQAAWKPTKVEANGFETVLERGQLLGSVRFLAQSWGWSRSKVERFLAALERENMLEAETPTGTGTKTPPKKLTLCNYDIHQRQLRQPETPTETPTETTYNKGEQGNNSIPPEEPSDGGRAKARGHRLPDDWQPKDHHYQLGQRLGLTTEQVNHEAAGFCDYWHAESGQRARKVNWDRGFNTWLRKSAERVQRSADGKPSQGNRSGPGSLVTATRDLLSGCGG